MGADMIGGSQLQSNLFLPLGKVRMGLRSGWVILWEGQDGLSFGEGQDGLSLWEGQDGLSLGKVRMGCPLGRSGWVLD